MDDIDSDSDDTSSSSEESYVDAAKINQILRHYKDTVLDKVKLVRFPETVAKLNQMSNDDQDYLMALLHAVAADLREQEDTASAADLLKAAIQVLNDMIFELTASAAAADVANQSESPEVLSTDGAADTVAANVHNAQQRLEAKQAYDWVRQFDMQQVTHVENMPDIDLGEIKAAASGTCCSW